MIINSPNLNSYVPQNIGIAGTGLMVQVHKNCEMLLECPKSKPVKQVIVQMVKLDHSFNIISRNKFIL